MKPEVMELLRAADPVDPPAVRGWASGEEGRRVWVETAAAVRRPARHPLWTRPRLALVSVGATVVALALVFGSMFLPERRGGETAKAAEILRSTAGVAAQQGDSHFEGRYRYTRSEIGVLSTEGEGSERFTVLLPFAREMWVAPDGSGRVHEKNNEVSFLRPRDRAAWEAAGRPALWSSGPTDDSHPSGALRYEDYSRLSTDPDVLFEQVKSRALSDPEVPAPQGAPIKQGMLMVVADLLSETIAPPKVRAALYEVTARIPDVELIGDVTDPAGRTGVAVGVTSEADSIRQELIFDPETSELLAIRSVLVAEVDWVDAEAGTTINWAVYLASGAVDSTSERHS